MKTEPIYIAVMAQRWDTVITETETYDHAQEVCDFTAEEAAKKNNIFTTSHTHWTRASAAGTRPT